MHTGVYNSITLNKCFHRAGASEENEVPSLLNCLLGVSPERMKWFDFSIIVLYGSCKLTCIHESASFSKKGMHNFGTCARLEVFSDFLGYKSLFDALVLV